MSRIEYWLFRRIVKKCMEIRGGCSAKCPYFRKGLKDVVPCRIGMPWNWQLGVKP